MLYTSYKVNTPEKEITEDAQASLSRPDGLRTFELP